MTDDNIKTSLLANTIIAQLTNQVLTNQTYNIIAWQILFTFDSEDDFQSGCKITLSHYTNYWYSWVQAIYNNNNNM